MVDRPHQVDQFLVDDADQLVGGVERLEDRFAHGLLGHPAMKSLATAMLTSASSRAR